MRFPVVLFDLDGTLIDSTSMILASFQHATRVVLGEAVPAEEIFAVVGGPTLEAQMRSFSAEHVDELVEVYRALSGEHPSWDEYRAAMVADRRLVVRFRATSASGMVSD